MGCVAEIGLVYLFGLDAFFVESSKTVFTDLVEFVPDVVGPVFAECPGVGGDDVEPHFFVDGLFVLDAFIVVSVADAPVVFDVGGEFGQVEIWAPYFSLAFVDDVEALFVLVADVVLVEELRDSSFSVRFIFRSIVVLEVVIQGFASCSGF